MIKYLPFILFGLFIDGLQAALSFAFLAMGSALSAGATATGAAAGCATGAAVGGAGGALAAGVGALPGAVAGCVAGAATGAFAGGAVGSVMAPLGIAVGMVVSICISLSFGVLLVLTLFYFGMFYPGRVFGGMFFEIIPGLSAVPGWTTVALICVLKKMQEDGTLQGSAAGKLASMLSPKNALGKMYGGVKSLQQRKVSLARSTGVVSDARVRDARIETRQAMKQDLKSIDGVTARPKTAAGLRSRTNYAV